MTDERREAAIEAAAKALFRAETDWPDFMWPQVKNERKEQCRLMASAAITAYDATLGGEREDDLVVERVVQNIGGQDRNELVGYRLTDDQMREIARVVLQAAGRATLGGEADSERGVWATVVIDPESMEPTEITDERFLEELSETGVSLERMFIRPGFASPNPTGGEDG